MSTDPWGKLYGGIPYNGHPCFLVNGPLDYTYLKVARVLLRCVGGWPLKELGENMLFFEGIGYAIYNIVLSIMFLILQAWYLFENAKKLSFFHLGHMYVALLMNVLSTSRGFTLCLSTKYKKMAVRFLTEIHVFFHKDKSDYSRHIYYKVHKISNWFSAYTLTLIALTLNLFNIVPVYINYKNGNFDNLANSTEKSFELAVYFKLPIDPQRNYKDYWYTFVLNWYGSFLCACSIIMFDLFLSIIIFNIWGHFKILLHDLANFPKPAALADDNINELQRSAVLYSPQEQFMVTAKLKEIILYHRMIIDFITELSECFGVVLFVYYTFHQVSGCLLILECSQSMEGLFRYLPLTVMMFAQLIQLSIIFETIGAMSEKLIDETYCLPWEYMNRENKTIVLLFLIKVQDPVHLKAGGLVDVGVQTMAGILKATLSYYAFLRTMSH